MLSAIAKAAQTIAVKDETFAPRAASDFYAGAFYGWLMYDVKFEMDTCFPDDSALGELLDEYW